VATHQLLCLKYSLRVKEDHATSIDFKPKDWWFPIINYALHDILPDNLKEATSIRWRSSCFYYDPVVKIPYRHSYDGILLRCLSNWEVQEALKEAHDDICGAHQPGPKFQDRLRWFGYYWPMMIADAVQYAKQCKVCQIQANFIHQPPEMFHPTVASCPFEAWRIMLWDPSVLHQLKVIGLLLQ